MKKNKKKKITIKPGIPLGISVEILALLISIFIISKTAPGAWAGTKYLAIGACFVSTFLGGLASYNGKFKSVVICAAVPALLKIILTLSFGQGSMLTAENISMVCALFLGGVLGGAVKTKKKKSRRK